MPKPISLAQQIDEVKYELGQRARVYPRICIKEPARQSELAYHVDRMEAVLRTLTDLLAQQKLKLEPADD